MDNNKLNNGLDSNNNKVSNNNQVDEYLFKKNAFMKKVVDLIIEDDVNRDYFILQIEYLLRNKRKKFYSKLLEMFVHLQFSEKEAKVHWQNIIEHCFYLNKELARNVGLRVAMVDYFINQNRILSNPMLIEIHIFRQTERMAMIDGLTGVFNRRYFDLALRKEFKRAIRYNKTFSIVNIYIDDFKKLNDTMGHLYGDVVLKKFAEFLKNSCRGEDIVCRYGGAEFMVILPEINKNQAYSFLERLKRHLKDITFSKIKNEFSSLTFSAGIANFPEHSTTIIDLLESVDKALFIAKSFGKDRIVIYDETL